MKKTYKYLFGLIILFSSSLFFTACDLNDFTYDGPPVVEFSNQTGTNLKYVWTSSAGNIWTGEIRGINHPDTAVAVALVGPHQKRPMEIGYFVAPEVFRNLSTGKTSLTQPEGDEGVQWVRMLTTATEGVDYTIRNNGIGSIAANSSFGRLPIGTSPTGDRFLYLVLQERDLKPSENYKIFRLRIRP